MLDIGYNFNYINVYIIYNVYKIVYVLVGVKSLCWNDVFVFFNMEIVIILVVFFSLFYWYCKYCIFWMFIFLLFNM